MDEKKALEILERELKELEESLMRFILRQDEETREKLLQEYQRAYAEELCKMLEKTHARTR